MEAIYIFIPPAIILIVGIVLFFQVRKQTGVKRILSLIFGTILVAVGIIWGWAIIGFINGGFKWF